MKHSVALVSSHLRSSFFVTSLNLAVKVFKIELGQPLKAKYGTFNDSFH